MNIFAAVDSLWEMAQISYLNEGGAETHSGGRKIDNSIKTDTIISKRLQQQGGRRVVRMRRSMGS